MADHLTLTDQSTTPKWRVFDEQPPIPPGTSTGTGSGLAWSVSPGETTRLGTRPPGDVVELTHVRSMLRLTGPQAARLINRICSLDLDDTMFPNHTAARTLLAGVATEIIRDDTDGQPSYLILPSSSFGSYITDVITDAGEEFDLQTA